MLTREKRSPPNPIILLIMQSLHIRLGEQLASRKPRLKLRRTIHH